MRISELDDIEKKALMNMAVDRARSDLNDGRPLTEMREKQMDQAATDLGGGAGELKTEQDLLPCPFCGSKSIVWSEHFRRVRCNGCFIGTAPLGEANFAPDVLERLKANSIAAWNKRTEIRDHKE